MIKSSVHFLSTFTFIAIFCLSLNLWAGGPMHVNSSGLVAHWEGMPISIHPEAGTCGDFSNGAMVAKLTLDAAYWSAITNIELSFDIVEGEVTEDVTVTNFNDIAGSESSSLHPFIFDSDGSITEDLFGQSSQYYLLGFAGFTRPIDDDAVIESGMALFNCLCIDNDTDCPAAVEEEELDATIVHEMGHFIGLGHSAVNEDLVNAPCDPLIAGDCDTVPIMYPTTFDAFEVLQLQQDDRIAALNIYGDSGWEDDYCTVIGSLLDLNGNDLRCADVQAQTDDSADTISFISGTLALAEDNNKDGDTVDAGECVSGCGDFILRLDPAKNYTLMMLPISESWISTSSVGPCIRQQLDGITQEQLALVSDCSAGETIDLGAIQTQYAGETESASDGGTTDSGSNNCGAGQDFSQCTPLIKCSLDSKQTQPQTLPLLISFMVWVIGQFVLRRRAIF